MLDAKYIKGVAATLVTVAELSRATCLVFMFKCVHLNI